MFVLLAMAAVASERDILAVLERQNADWNRGDTRAFVSFYADDTVFVSSDSVARGAGPLLERYQKRYPNKAAMGHLTFSELEVHMLGSDQAYVIGRWRLDRTQEAGGNVGGRFSLVFQKRNGAWKIILDHTS
jgi:uncharacterized protein (TIGR02246 family)